MPQKSSQNLEEGKLQENDNALSGDRPQEDRILPLNQEKLKEEKRRESKK